jgi:hypothetical protein
MKLPHYIKITEDTEYGDSKLFRIRLNPKYKDNKGLMLHEYTHVKQWYIGFAVGLIGVLAMYLYTSRLDYTLYALTVAPFLKGLLYTFIAPCRLYLEVQAFAKQISIEPVGTHDYYMRAFGKDLATKYNVNVTPEAATEKLRKQLAKILRTPL